MYNVKVYISDIVEDIFMSMIQNPDDVNERPLLCTWKINILFFGRVCVSKCHRGSKAEYTCRLVVTVFISGRLIDLVALGKLFRDDLLHLYWIKIEYFHISLFLERLNVSLSKGTHVVSSFVTLFISGTKIFLDHLSLIELIISTPRQNLFPDNLLPHIL